ncbi:MAG: hypothetical protein Q8Q35_01340 [Nanoarchaeota archaeon]|nr:hypothetical protein [Nanoarchaeota archaeon]
MEIKPKPFMKEREQQTTLNVVKKESKYLTRKDVFLMSFLAFLLGGLVLTSVFFLATTSGMFTSDGGTIVEEVAAEEAVVEEKESIFTKLFNLISSSGEEEVINVSSEDAVLNETVEVVINETVEEVAEVVEEEVVEEVDDDCGTDFTVTTSGTTISGKIVKLVLAGDFDAMYTVGGKSSGLVSRGTVETVNGLDLKMDSTSDGEIVLELMC